MNETYQPQSPPPRSDRLAGVDAAKFLAAIAIIWIHTADSETAQRFVPLCRVAVPFFVASLTAFNLQHILGGRSTETLSAFTWRKFRRLYVPFFVWSLVYLSLRFLKHQFVDNASLIILRPGTLLTGTAHHLWFLPLAFLLSVCVRVFGAALKRFGPLVQMNIGIGIGIAGILMAVISPSFVVDAEKSPVTYFAAMSWGAIPSALLSIPLVLTLRHSQPISQTAYGGVAFTAAFSSLILFGPHPLQASVGGVSLWFLAQTPFLTRWNSILTLLGSISFGIYLVHVALIEGIQTFLRAWDFRPSILIDLLVATSTLGCSVTIVIAARKFKKLSRLFPS